MCAKHIACLNTHDCWPRQLIQPCCAMHALIHVLVCILRTPPGGWGHTVSHVSHSVMVIGDFVTIGKGRCVSGVRVPSLLSSESRAVCRWILVHCNIVRCTLVDLLSPAVLCVSFRQRRQGRRDPISRPHRTRLHHRTQLAVFGPVTTRRVRSFVTACT